MWIKLNSEQFDWLLEHQVDETILGTFSLQFNPSRPSDEASGWDAQCLHRYFKEEVLCPIWCKIRRSSYEKLPAELQTFPHLIGFYRETPILSDRLEIYSDINLTAIMQDAKS